MLGVLFTMCVLLLWVNHFHLMVQLNPLKILGQHPQSRKRDVFLWKWGNIYPFYSDLQAVACMAAVWAGLRLGCRGTATISASFKLLVGDLWLSRFYQTWVHQLGLFLGPAPILNIPQRTTSVAFFRNWFWPLLHFVFEVLATIWLK